MGDVQTHAMADEVDRIVAAWERERPDLDASPLAVLSRVSRLSRLLDRARAHALDAHDLQQWEFDVLAALRRAGPPFTAAVGVLMRETIVASATMTHRIDRLAARGLVERLPDPDDRRGVLVRLTHAGRHATDDTLADLLESERVLLAPLTAHQRRALADLLRHLLTPLE
jgi:DNA-binding MarR family transcriptional regulator